MFKNLLIVEDEILLALEAKVYFTSQGIMRCDIAVDYQEAVEFLNKYEYDAAILDIILKGTKTGLDLSDYINTKLHIPVIFTTGNSDDATISRIKEKHPVGYFIKPVNLKSLHQLIIDKLS